MHPHMLYARFAVHSDTKSQILFKNSNPKKLQFLSKKSPENFKICVFKNLDLWSFFGVLYHCAEGHLGPARVKTFTLISNCVGHNKKIQGLKRTAYYFRSFEEKLGTLEFRESSKGNETCRTAFEGNTKNFWRIMIQSCILCGFVGHPILKFTF